MGHITHFEITAPDVGASLDFFTRAFGWAGESSPYVPDYLTVETGSGDGIDGAIMSSRYQSQPVIIWLDVDDIESAIASVEEAGGASAGAINDIPIGRVTYVTDPAGVLYGLRQPH